MISLLLPDLRGGGTERVSLDLAHQFAREGHSVEFILMQSQGELLEEAQAEYTVFNLNTPRAREVPQALACHLHRRRPDAMLAAMWPLTAIAPMMRLMGYRGRVVVSEHGILSAQYHGWGLCHRPMLRASAALGYRLAHSRVGVSSGVAADMAGLSGIDRGRFETIYNPVPPHLTPDIDALKRVDSLWPVCKGGRILTVGALKPVKNHRLLLQALALVTHPGACLIIVGMGAGEADLRRLATELGIADRVILAGFHSDPTPFYMTADVFALSSDHEGFGNVIVEAMACGTPVVSTDCPSGPGEILEGGRWGDLVSPGDAGALAAAIDRALARTHDPVALRRRAADFAPEIAARRYLQLLKPS